MNLKATIRRALPNPLLWRLTAARVYWAAGNDTSGNFGDQLTPALLERLYGQKSKFSGMQAADLVGVGSLFEGIEEHCQARTMIWGSGFIQEGPPYDGAKLDVRAVRGALTAARLGSMAPAGLALGDPGLLTSAAYPEFSHLPRRGIAVIPHFMDKQDPVVERAAAHPDVRIVEVLAPLPNVLREIASAEIVLSSSLHGLVVADSYGVPNQWTPIGDGVTGSGYKFRDYYSAFGTEATPMTLDEALANVESLRDSWRPQPNIEQVKRSLLRSFPRKPIASL
ncbi:MAG: polysaccharide pyruvyl transferase family protein [Propionibacteriaceae bacterium]|nr:polysaccharide pyruvyl transferase family protein [Propionibacteriaceae bacterium]